MTVNFIQNRLRVVAQKIVYQQLFVVGSFVLYQRHTNERKPRLGFAISDEDVPNYFAFLIVGEKACRRSHGLFCPSEFEVSIDVF
jgi:hypothetical protein